MTAQLALPFKEPVRSTAAEFVRSYLLGVLPPGTPPQFTSIDRAWFTRNGVSKRAALAEMTLVDGGTCTVEVTEHTALGMKWRGHSYPVWNGPALFYEDGCWRRGDILDD